METSIAQPRARRSLGVLPRPLFPAEKFLILGVAMAGVVLFVQGREVMALFLMGWLVLGSLYFAVRDFESALAIYAFAIPFEQIFAIWGGTPWNLLTYLLIVMVVIGMIRPNQRPARLRLTMPEIWLGLWVLWSAITLAWGSLDLATGFKLVVQGFSGVLLISAFYRWAKSREIVFRWLAYFIMASLLATMANWLYYEPGTALVWVEHKARFEPSVLAGPGTTGLASNVYARTTLVAMLGALAFWEFSATRFRRNIALGLGVFLGVMVPLAYSRAVMVAQAVALLVWAFLGRFRRTKKIFLGAIVILIVGSGAWMINSEALMLRVNATRLGIGDQDYRLIMSGRNYIWAEGWEIFLEHPILGVGYGGFASQYSARTYDSPRDDHNVYLGVLVESGIIGGLFFLAFFVSMGIKALRTGPWRHITLAWWIAFVIVIGASTAAHAKEFWFSMGLVMVLVRHVKQQRRDKRALAYRAQ